MGPSARIARVLLAVVALGALAFVALTLVSELQGQSMLAELETRWGSFEEVLERFPARAEPNEAALELEALAAEMGIGVVPLARRAGRLAEGYEHAVDVYLGEELSRAPSLTPAAPPPDVAAYLATHAAQLRRLLEVGDPRWEREIDLDEGERLPNLLGLIRVQRTLLVWALSEIHAGRDDEALRILDASWRLSAALWEEPHLITRLIALACERYLVTILLRVDSLPDEWLERLEVVDRSVALENGLRLEIWLLAQEERRPGGILGYPVIRTISRPYVRLCQLDAARASAALLQEALSIRRSCASGDLGTPETVFRRLAWWHPYRGDFDRILSPHAAMIRARRLRLEAELATIWFARRRFAPDARIRSEACRGRSWVFSSTEGGRRTLALEGGIELDGLPGHPVNTRMEEAP